LLPTSYDNLASDEAFVESYNTTSGIAKLNGTLNYYHWGAKVSTANDFNGADIRGEVILMTRNIKIAGQDIESWGG
jgi:hypothetical protein